MMTSADGRIDCAMTEQLPGVSDYYKTLDKLKVPSTVSGRVTAELEMADKGFFKVTDPTKFGKEGFKKNSDAYGYEIVTDTNGKLLWHNADSEKPYLIITSENVTCEYLRYLDGNGISWIACGKDRIDLSCACEILYESFGIERMGVVGGPTINTAFLNGGLLDEISLLIGAGIDGRADMPSVFDGRDMSYPLTSLTLTAVEKFVSGTVWLRYKIK